MRFRIEWGMELNSSVHVSPSLVITLKTPHGTQALRISRLHAQILATTLRTYSDPRVGKTAPAFDLVFGESIAPAPKHRPPVVRLGKGK